MKRLDEVAATSERPTCSTVKPELPGALAINVDVDGRIIERLTELQIAQARNLLHLGQHLIGEGAVGREIRSAHRDLDRRRRTEVHNLVTMSPASNEKLDCRDHFGQFSPQSFLEFSELDAGAASQLATSSTASCGPLVQR